MVGSTLTILTAMFAAVVGADTPHAGIWVTAADIAARPMSGPAWVSLLEEANQPAGVPDISDQNDNTDMRTLAKALAYARTGDSTYRVQVVETCLAAMETENGGRTLALGRNLLGYVIAASLVGMPPSVDAAYRSWLDQVRYEELEGRTLISTHEDRPNNWGTHAGASRMAIAIYLGDTADLEAAASVFKGWLGDREAYDGFDYGELWWQADPETPVGINPIGSTILGHPVDGVLPDDQRRGGPFEWPPPQENYVYTALQGAVAQAVILDGQGYDVWNWSDRAMLRAFTWLHEHAHYPAVGDDTWQPHLINWFYGSCFPAPVPAQYGKNIGWTDWTHGICMADFNGDGQVNVVDLLFMLLGWGPDSECQADLDGDGIVSITDFLQLLSQWGPCY